MKNFKKIFGKKGLACTALLAIVLFFSASVALAQQSFIIDPASSMTVSGTSSLHDWTSDVTKLNGSAQIAVQGNQIESIDRLSLNIPVTSIKSGKSGMDKNTYEALKNDKHPEIKFQLKQIKTNGSGQVNALGDLTIAGVTKSIEMPVRYSVEASSKVEFKGSISFKMSEFKIDPPTALMGTVKTGDQVTLNFETVFVKR